MLGWEPIEGSAFFCQQVGYDIALSVQVGEELPIAELLFVDGPKRCVRGHPNQVGVIFKRVENHFPGSGHGSLGSGGPFLTIFVGPDDTEAVRHGPSRNLSDSPSTGFDFVSALSKQGRVLLAG